jgi:hypothetical protein
MKRTIPYTSILLFSLFVWVMMSGCKKDHCLDCFKSAGEQVSEDRSCSDISEIELYDRINLYLTQDTFCSIRVEAGEHLIKGVITEVEGSRLIIRNENRCNWVRSFDNTINVYLSIRTFRKIDYRGAGEVKSTNTITNDTVELNFWDGSGLISLDVVCKEARVHCHTGCGDGELRGNAESAYFYNRGNGQIRCSELRAKSAIIDSKCTNDCYIYASESLSARIGYIGNVYYKGNPPVIDSVITERGHLIHML